MKSDTKKRKIFVGVSGGVDSSVSLYLLKKAGHDVTGVFIRTWSPDFVDCTWKDERRDAMRVCAELDVPYMECDAEDAYKKGVADYMIEEYKKGRTPNPDVMCNREVKFGVFWQFAKSHGADAIATGHYARISPNYEFLKGTDESKDQAYFLWTLKQEELDHILFPVGDMQKEEVRKIAKKIGLSNAKKKDSQGVCFLGPINMREFLKHYIEETPGNVINTEGKVIGHHDGSVFFTIGERHGFVITEKSDNESPYYVVEKDVNKNTITVSNRTKESFENKIEVKEILLSSPVLRTKIDDNKVYDVQFRYHGEYFPCKVKHGEGEKRMTLAPVKTFPNVALGQSSVIYDGEICIGGGIVDA